MKYTIWKIAFGIVCAIFLIYVPMTLFDILIMSRGISFLYFIIATRHGTRFMLSILIIVLMIWFWREAFRKG